MEKDLSIVIVNWNTRDLLRGCLSSLPRACEDHDFETLVVDNQSTDGSAQMVEKEFPHCLLLPGGGNLGFSRGNNLAFRQCRGAFVLLLNPDTICPPGSLTKLLNWARKQKNLGAVSPLLTDAQGTPTITFGYFPAARFHWLGLLDPLRLLPGRWLQKRIVCIPEPEHPTSQVDYVAGACFLMPRPALELVGPLDERFFMYFEETDWCWRARQAGLSIWYYHEARVVHLEGRAAEKASEFTTRQFQKSYRLFVDKNYGSKTVWRFRLAQFFEYGWKGLLRSVVPWHRARNQALANTYFRRARLQWEREIAVSIPGGPGDDPLETRRDPCSKK